MVDGAIRHLPSTNADLFGRDAELAWLDACWRDGVFVASIVAWGGVGKTSLVTKWLAKMRDDGWRGAERVFDWSFYQQGTNTAGSSDTFFAESLAKFGDPDPTKGSPWDKGERLAKLVRAKRTLLVLDGVEPMQYGPGEQEGHFKDPALQTLVKELASNSNGFLLITSRLRLTDLEGMSGAKVQTKALEHLSADAGAALLRARGAKGTDAELQVAANEYRGHALALTLLGSYLEDVAEGDIRRRNEIGPLHHDERNGGHARRVMTSYESLLGKTELAILRMLGLFDRPATEEELAALRADPVVPSLTDALMGVTGRDWNKALAKLKRVHLIATETGKAIDAHPLVRQHFSEQLKLENIDGFREGHRRLYEFLRTSAKEFPETITEMDPLYKAVVHGCLAGRNQEALDEVWWKRIWQGKTGFSFYKLGAFGREIAMLGAFFNPPWEHISPGLSDGAEGFVLRQGSLALAALGRYCEAVTLSRLRLEWNVSRSRWRQAAESASTLSGLFQETGKLREALAMAQTGIDFANRSGDTLFRMALTATWGTVLHALGDSDVISVFVDVERMQQEWQPQLPLLYSYRGFQYCDILLDIGRETEVRKRATITLRLSQLSSILLDIALDHLSLGCAHLVGIQNQRGGDLAEATSHVHHAIEKFREAGVLAKVPLGLLARAELYIHTREFANARRDLNEAMTIATRCGFRLHEADAHLGYARLALAEHKLGDARKHIEKARTIVNETGYHRRDRDLAELEAMTKNQLLDAICKLRETEIDTLIFKLDIPTANLPGKSATPNARVIDLLKWAEARNRLAEVEQKYQELMGHGESVDSGPNAGPNASTTAPATSPLNAAAQEPVDLGIVVALQDEFRDLLSMSASYTQHKTEKLTAYRFTRGTYRIVAAFAGDMGQSQASRVAERMIDIWRPESVVVMGIAGGVHDDLRVGDVYVPTQAIEYIQDGKAIPNPKKPSEFVFTPGGPARRADYALIDAARNLEFGHPSVYSRFIDSCAEDLPKLLKDDAKRKQLVEQNLIRANAAVLADGHVATGPVVGAAEAFTKWIRSHDRNVKALEMETAGVFMSAQEHSKPTRAFAIRGISDYGDDRKKALAEIGEGALRKYAMRNAVRFLWALLDANALPR